MTRDLLEQLKPLLSAGHPEAAAAATAAATAGGAARAARAAPAPHPQQPFPRRRAQHAPRWPAHELPSSVSRPRAALSLPRRPAAARGAGPCGITAAVPVGVHCCTQRWQPLCPLPTLTKPQPAACRGLPTPFTGRRAWLPPRIVELFYHKVLGPMAALSYLYHDPTQLGGEQHWHACMRQSVLGTEGGRECRLRW